MTLNRAQRVIVKIGGCVVFLRLLFPPWITQQGGLWVGDYLIFSPPGFQEIRPYYPVKVAAVLLFFQIVTIATGTALLVWWFQPHQASAQSPSQKPNKRSFLQRFSILRSDVYVLLFLLLFVSLTVLAVLSGW